MLLLDVSRPPPLPEVVEVTTEPTTDQHDHDQHDHDPHTVRPVLRLWRKAKADSKRDSQARRDRVLTHEDLAQRLTEPPLRLSHPARWSGWIPPRLLAEEACTHCQRDSRRPACRDQPHRPARFNGSPIRRQLVEIAAEAMARESGR